MFHKEGYKIITTTIASIIVLNGFVFYLTEAFSWQAKITSILSIVILVLILQFFRNPKRHTILNSQHIIAPADGKVVVIEEVEEQEYLQDKRVQVSIFMSPLNVHVNRYPISGEVKYAKHHHGKFLVAWHPKSSIENERTTVVVENKNTGPILFRQIAGALAKRIVMYAKRGDKAEQGKDMGFIKFGSRIDLYLPLNSKINIELNQSVKGGQTVIAEL